jgi:hypothetical protein
MQLLILRFAVLTGTQVYSLSCIDSLLRQGLSENPELPYGHFEIATDRRHDIARYVCLPAFDPP